MIQNLNSDNKLVVVLTLAKLQKILLPYIDITQLSLFDSNIFYGFYSCKYSMENKPPNSQQLAAIEAEKALAKKRQEENERNGVSQLVQDDPKNPKAIKDRLVNVEIAKLKLRDGKGVANGSNSVATADGDQPGTQTVWKWLSEDSFRAFKPNQLKKGKMANDPRVNPIPEKVSPRR